MGVSVSDTKPETRIATEIVAANSRNTRPTTPPMKKTGMNTATSDSVIETMVKPISREPFERRVERLHPLFDVADDVLQHHDGVVDDEADRQRQRQQRDIVDRVAEHVHRRERADQRDRAARASG